MDLMFGQHTCVVPMVKKNKMEYCTKNLYKIGADDSHADFAKYIIRNGRTATETFITDPKNQLIIDLSKKINSEGSAIDFFNTDGQIIPGMFN
jgi:hypothetical protein